MGLVGKDEEDLLRLCHLETDDHNYCVSLNTNGSVKFWNLSSLANMETPSAEDKVQGKLKGQASTQNLERNHFLNTLGNNLDIPDDKNISSDESSEWVDTDTDTEL